MNRVVHFEIHAQNPERAVAFYQGVFGWKVEKWEGPVDYWLLSTGEKGTTGIDGAILRRNGESPNEKSPVNGYINTIEVNSIDKTSELIKEHQGINVVPKMEISGVGWLAYFKDTEGNIFGIMENNK